jgi:hypothetical protein
VNYPKEKILAGFDGHKRKWTLLKSYENYGLYKCGEIRECFKPFDLDIIKKRKIKDVEEEISWKIRKNKTIREYLDIIKNK